MDIENLLTTLGIPFERLSHEPIMTMEEGMEIADKLRITPVKNLFLVDKQGQHYLLLLEGNKKFKAKVVSKQLGCSHLSFASPEDMQKLLGINPGAVSVLALANDEQKLVRLLIDRDILAMSFVGCHPGVNTASVKLRTDDLLKVFLPHINHADFEIVEV